MRKRVIFIMLASIMCLSGCGEVAGTSSRGGQGPKTVNEVLEEGVAAQNASSNISKEEAQSDSNSSAQADASVASSESSVDFVGADGDYIDLSQESSGMVYSIIINMAINSDNFIGKTIKMRGTYSDMYVKEKDRHYFACLVMDATACCSQGVEFELTDDYKFPDDYPYDGDEIVVEGVFDMYDEDGEKYPVLRNAELYKLKSQG